MGYERRLGVMNKCFCDKCKKELKGKEKHTGEIRIRGFYSKSFLY